MSSDKPHDEVLDDARFILNQIAMRELLPNELTDEELNLVLDHGQEGLLETQEQLNALAEQCHILTPSPSNLSRLEKERERIRRGATRLLEAYSALFSCITEKTTRNLHKI